MTPAPDWAGPAALLAAAVPGARPVAEFGQVRVEVPASGWVEAACLARDHPGVATPFFDVLTAVDLGEDSFEVMVHLWAPGQGRHALLVTTVAGAPPHLASLTPQFPGANWHEREVWESYGVVFDGHPRLEPLLVPDTAPPYPLRKSVLLAARAQQPWPGAAEPGGLPRRRPLRAPGQPDPGAGAP